MDSLQSGNRFLGPHFSLKITSFSSYKIPTCYPLYFFFTNLVPCVIQNIFKSTFHYAFYQTLSHDPLESKNMLIYKFLFNIYTQTPLKSSSSFILYTQNLSQPHFTHLGGSWRLPLPTEPHFYSVSENK